MELACRRDDPWHEHPMRDPSARRATRAPNPNGGPPTWVNTETHWWDGSQIYGSDAERRRRCAPASTASCGSTSAGCFRRSSSSAPRLRGRAGNALGRARRCCTACSCASTTPSATTCTSDIPSSSDDELYDKARLVTRADREDPHGRVDAGDHRPPDDGARRMQGNWWGLAGERFAQAVRPHHARTSVIRGLVGRARRPPRRAVLADRGVRLGLPHAPADARRVTRSARCATTRCSQERTFRELGALDVRERLRRDRDGRRPLLARHRRTRARSRCTTSRASCRSSTAPDGKMLDLAPIDILRVRERGVPRYNAVPRALPHEAGRRRSRS